MVCVFCVICGISLMVYLRVRCLSEVVCVLVLGNKFVIEVVFDFEYGLY